MKFVKTSETTVVGNRVRYAGSVVAVEDPMAADMVKYGKGTLHPGPTLDLFDPPAAGFEASPEAALPPAPVPERLDLGSKLDKAERATSPARRAGAI
jgi:hypothetical protein